ncbi:MAG: nucleotidyl transferase AbiEii/AbiGii toxin family protein [Blastochloris sp.]|nr:nucleotidyl transferase AbiEii/AbiGii toxin family protein [Blastochloris sp.]
MPLFNQLQAKIASVLDELQVPYMMIGGVATIAYTKPRFTEDVDLTIGVSMFDAKPVIAALAKAGIKARTGHSTEMMRNSSLLLAVDRASGVTIDISFSDSPYEKEAMSRAKKVRRAGKTVRIATAEDLIIHKMIAARPRDLQDIEGILLRQRKLDWTYMNHWLRLFGEVVERPLTDELEKLRQELDV